MIVIDKFLCVFQLQWGIVTIGIIDTITSLLNAYKAIKLYGEEDKHDAFYWLCRSAFVFYCIHLIACALLIASVYQASKTLVIMYLFSNITRLLTVSVIFIFAQLKTTYGDTIIEYIVMLISIYFWVCAFSWYVMLSNSQTAPND